MEHGLKVIALYVQKAYNTLHSCHNFPAGSGQAARGALICQKRVYFGNYAQMVTKFPEPIVLCWTVL